MKEITVQKNDAGQRLDRFIHKAVPRLPQTLIQKYIRTKRIKRNGKGTNRGDRIILGDVISLYISNEFFEAPPRKTPEFITAPSELNIVFEDENILLLNKAPGILCHSAGEYNYDTLVARIHSYLQKKGDWDPRSENSFAPALCNRIDRNTGGIVIAAKNAEALRAMNAKILAGEVDRLYLCAVFGTPKPKSGKIQDYLRKHPGENRVQVLHEIAPGAKSAVMEYRTLASAGELSLLECRLLTGRTHQIRAQLSVRGTPLLGDVKYGNPEKNRLYRERRQALWAHRVSFSFQSDAGILNYLKGREFSVSDIPFVKKHFKNYFSD